jgi:hypothetical protein
MMEGGRGRTSQHVIAVLNHLHLLAFVRGTFLGRGRRNLLARSRHVVVWGELAMNSIRR